MKYSELINQIKYTVHPNKDKTYESIRALCRRHSQKKLKGVAALLICTFFISVGVLGLIRTVPIVRESDLPQELAEISPVTSVRATSSAGSFISDDSSLRLTTSKALSKKELAECISITPSTDYKITKNTANTFTLSFTEPLKDNTLYSVQALKNNKAVYSWAFQTQADFVIEDHYPKDKTENSFDCIYVDFTHSTVYNFAESFSIYPAVSGTFEHYGNRWKFIPSTEFESGVIYTVTIAKSVQTADGETLADDFTFSFTAGNIDMPETYINYLSEDMIDTFSESQPIAEIVSEEDLSDISKVDVYKIPSAEEFIAFHKAHIGDRFISEAIGEEISKFDKLDSFTPDVENVENTSYIHYPDSFAKGYYVSEIITEHGSLYHIFQITDLSVDTLTFGGDYTVWVNNAFSKSAQADARVTLEGYEDTVTDSNGIAVFENCSVNNKYAYITVKTGSSSYVTRISASEPTKEYSDEYIANIQTDRSVYMAGDTVKLFGFIQPSNNGASNIDSIKLSSELFAGDITVSLDKDGAFEYQFTLPAYIDNVFQEIVLSSGNSAITSYSFKVTNSFSTEYLIDVLTDKGEYFDGEEINYTISARFSDGTPIEDLEVTAPDGSDITTDSDGLAYYSVTANHAEQTDAVKFDVLQPDGNIVSFYNSVNIYPSDICVTATEADGKITALVTDSVSGASIDAELEIELHTVTFSAKNGKITQDDTVTESFKQETFGGSLSFGINALEEKDTQQYYKITAKSEEHSDAASIIYIYNGFHYSESSDYMLCTDKAEYTVGDTVHLAVYKNGKEFYGDGKILISFLSDGIIKNTVYSSDAPIEFECLDEFGESTEISAAYFDGKTISFIGSTQITVKKNVLDISVKTDKKSYQPGDEVSVTLETSEDRVLSPDSNLCITLIGKAYGVQEAVNEQVLTSDIYKAVSTDKNGTAQLDFVLPESNNDWLLRVGGINEKGLKGYTEIPIDVDNEFYVKTFTGDTVKVSDDCIFSFEFCTEFISDASCQYSVSLLKNGKLLDSFNDTADVNIPVSQSFGKLEEGDYTVRISAKYLDKALADDFAFSVGSAYDKEEYETEEHTEQQTEIDTAVFESDVTLTVYDESYSFYQTVSKKLRESDSADPLTAVTEHYLYGQEISIKDIKSIYLAKPQDVKALASYSAVFKGFTDKYDLKERFESCLYESTDTLSIISCYLGLATLGEPVLDELMLYYNNIDALDIESKAYLALAFAYAGDNNTANAIYNNHISDKIKAENGVAYYTGGATAEETMYMTSIISHLAGKISRSDAKETVKALLSNENGINKYKTEIAAFLINCQPELSGKNRIEIIYPDGNKEKISYDRASVLIKTIPEDIKGTVTVISKSGVSYTTARGSVYSSFFEDLEA